MRQPLVGFGSAEDEAFCTQNEAGVWTEATECCNCMDGMFYDKVQDKCVNSCPDKWEEKPLRSGVCGTVKVCVASPGPSQAMASITSTETKTSNAGTIIAVAGIAVAGGLALYAIFG